MSSDVPCILVITAGFSDKRDSVSPALVDQYNTEVLPGKVHHEGRKDRVLSRFGMGAVWRNLELLNQAILERAGTFDILFVVKGNFVRAETLKMLKTLPNPPAVLGWTCDDMYLPHNNSAIFKAAAPYYDIFYTAKSLNIARNELVQMGFRHVEFLHQGFDRDVHKPLKVSGSIFEDKVVFIGFGETDRFNKMNYLAKNGIEIHTWGNGWTNWMKMKAHKNLHIHGHPLLGAEYAEALSNAKISLCFLRKLNCDLHTARTFEIPACGGFMLAERTDEHREYFTEDREAVYFDGEKELLDKVKKYMKDDEKRNAIAEAGYSRTRDSDYSYHRLTRDIIENILSS